jgi:hypothetical protein
MEDGDVCILGRDVSYANVCGTCTDEMILGVRRVFSLAGRSAIAEGWGIYTLLQ